MAATDTTLPDAAGNWADRLPAPLRPYARLARWDRPIGWQLLMWPCWWSTVLAWPHAPETGWTTVAWYLALFAIGAFAMRGAGCTYNDIVDRDLDARVARTRHRPLASGRVSVKRAALFMGLQALLGLLVLLQFNGATIRLGLASLLVVALYPFAKRVTHWPQAVLGVAFSWGALVGWSALVGGLDAAPLALFAGSVFWVVSYDTIYAHQDREDDREAGIGSTALRFGDRTGVWLGGLYTAATLCLALALVLAAAPWPAWIGLAAFAAMLAWQVRDLDIDDADACLRLFRRNHPAGSFLFLGLLLAALWDRLPL